MVDKEEKKEKSVSWARKFVRIIKKGRDGNVKFQVYRKSPRNPKFLKKISIKSTFDRYSILMASYTSKRFYKNGKI